MMPILRTSWPSFLNEFLNNESLNNMIDAPVYQRAAVNIRETKDNFQIEIIAPGVEKSDLKVNLDHQALTISFEKEVSTEENDGRYLRKEFSLSSFSRSFTLPDTADTDNITAEHVSGVLYLKIPKKEESKVKPP